MGKEAAEELPARNQARLSEWMDSAKWRLWHGRAAGAITRLQSMLGAMAHAGFRRKSFRYCSETHPKESRSLPNNQSIQHVTKGFCIVVTESGFRPALPRANNVTYPFKSLTAI